MIQLLYMSLNLRAWNLATDRNSKVGYKMRITFAIRDGVPSKDDASRRNLQALRWLAERHEVLLLPVYDNSHSPPPLPEEESHLRDRLRRDDIRVLAPVPDPISFPFLSIRGLRGLSLTNPRSRAEINRLILSRTMGSDWLWVADPALVNSRALLRDLRVQRTAVTWDWDALSLLSFKFAAANFPDPRSTARLLEGLSWVLTESTHFRRFSAISVPGPADQRWLRRVTGRDILWLRPLLDLDDFRAARELPGGNGPVVLFIGSAWKPNVDGINWFIKKVWPMLRHVNPSATLRIVGRGLTTEPIRTGGPGIELVGEVSSVIPELTRARVIIAPVFYGAGIPTKLLEASAAAKAIVTTPYCAETVGGRSPFIVAHDPQDWVRHLSALLADLSLSVYHGQQNLQYVTRQFGQKPWEDTMRAIEAIVGGDIGRN